MKKVLQSLFTIALVAVVLFETTGAYFSSEVTASDNEINTGTLMMAVDSTRAHNYVGTWNTGVGLSWDGVTAVGTPFDAYVVAYDNDGVLVNNYQLEPWNNAAPGPYEAYNGGVGIEDLADGNYSVWMTVRNWGSIDAKAMLAFTGDWNGMRDTQACIDSEGAGNDELIRVRNVHVYQTGANNCENHEECRNLRDSLNTMGYSYTTDADLASVIDYGTDSALEGFQFYLSSNGVNTGNEIALGEDEYAIMRVDLQFQPGIEADYNCYQGAQYLYDVAVTGNQLVDPIW